MAKLLFMVAVALFALAGDAAGHRGAGERRSDDVLILVIHGGAFCIGSPSNMTPQVRIARRVAPGAQVRNVGYPLGNPTEAYRAVRAVAREHDGPVVAYGFSAGGYLSARLAAAGDVRAAVSFAGIYDLAAYAEHVGADVWGRAILDVLTEDGRRLGTLVRGPRAAPNALFHGRADPKVPIAQARRYAGEHRGVRLVALDGVEHRQPRGAVRRSMAWLVRKARERR